MGPHETAKPQRKALGRPGRQPGRRRAVLRAQDGGGAVSAQPAAQLGTSPCTWAAAFAELQSPQQTGRLKARGPQQLDDCSSIPTAEVSGGGPGHVQISGDDGQPVALLGH